MKERLLYRDFLPDILLSSNNYQIYLHKVHSPESADFQRQKDLRAQTENLLLY